PKEPEGEESPMDFVERVARHGIHHCVAIEAAQLILSRVFDRFPRLQIYWAENNIGWIPYFYQQMDQAYKVSCSWAERLLGLKRLSHLPSEYLKEHAHWGFFDDPIGIQLRHYVGMDRIINDGIDVITTTGSFGECYNLHWDEYKTLAVAAVDAVKKRVPLFIGATSPNAREVVERLKFVQDIGGDGTLLGVPYYDAQSPEYMADFYTQIAEMFPKLGFLIYHNPVNHKVKIPV